jgi:hypothetical protein
MLGYEYLIILVERIFLVKEFFIEVNTFDGHKEHQLMIDGLNQGFSSIESHIRIHSIRLSLMVKIVTSYTSKQVR